tara:strand:- start:246 stop:470 length:225 start_codon:yes stop_codon:yes gene_type:complete
MDKKTKSDIALYLLGHGNVPKGIPSHTRDAAISTRQLKVALDSANTYQDVVDSVKNRSIAAGVYSTKTKLKWPF